MDKGSKKAERLHKSTFARIRRRGLKDMIFERTITLFARLKKMRKKRK